MRAMRKGDLAFFYHSNTKVPGVAGIMEIVEEHSIDGIPNNEEMLMWPKLMLDGRVRLQSGFALLRSQIFARQSKVGARPRAICAQVLRIGSVVGIEEAWPARRCPSEPGDVEAVEAQRVCRQA